MSSKPVTTPFTPKSGFARVLQSTNGRNLNRKIAIKYTSRQPISTLGPVCFYKVNSRGKVYVSYIFDLNFANITFWNELLLIEMAKSILSVFLATYKVSSSYFCSI